MRALFGVVCLLGLLCMASALPDFGGLVSQFRRLQMQLELSNETVVPIPVLELPKDTIHDNPMVGDAGKVGGTLPPSNPLPALSAAKLSMPFTGEYVAICTVTSDRGDYVREWMEYHLKMGIHKFYIFDHNKIPILHSFADYWKIGLVEYFAVPDRHLPWRQFAVIETCLRRYRMRHHWIAFIDTDEFLVIREPGFANMSTFLKPFEPFGGIGVNWRVFGSSGHVARPEGKILESYHKCTEKTNGINEHVKSIVNPRYVLQHANNPHAFMYQDGYFAVNEHMKMIPTGKGTSRGAVTVGTRSSDRLELYHFTTRSIEEYTKKVMRGSINKTPGKTLQWFQDLDASCIETCADALLLLGNRTMPDVNGTKTYFHLSL